MQTKNLLYGAALLALSACGSPQGVPQATSDLDIYGGKKVTQQDEVARFTVVLQQNNQTVCTGVLVSDRLVATAAHCFYLLKSSQGVSVGFGLKAKGATSVPVANFVAHEDFDAQAGQMGGIDRPVNDVGLIRLAKDAPEGYEPIAVLGPEDSLQIGEKVILAGYGKTDVPSGWFGTVLGELYQVETELALEAPQAKEVWFGNTPGKSACNGDSGGPAVVRRGQELKLLGVTSRGRDCKSEVIYTDLRFFDGWLAQAAEKLGS